MNWQRSLRFILPLFVLKLDAAWCIQCYHCNSVNNTACLDPARYDEATRRLLVPTVDCELFIPFRQGQLFCRKIEQYIVSPEEHRRHNVEKRVARGCGWARHDQAHSCYTGTHSHHVETVCQCFHSDCNLAPPQQPGLIPLAAAATLLIMYHCS